MQKKIPYIILTLLFFFVLQNQSILHAQKRLNLAELDYSNSRLKTVEAHYNNGDYSGAVNSLLEYYVQKDDIYKRVSKEDRTFLSNIYADDMKLSARVADEVKEKYFVFREEWDMERTNIPYQFENEINWNINPFGDPEWTWMLNRHKYWTHLGKAYYFTQNEKYAQTFVDQVTHWIKNNPLKSLDDIYNNTAAWRRIEAGIRCENWIKSFEYVKSSRHVTPEFFDLFLNSLLLHGAYLNNSFSNFSKTSNWGVLEYHGLLHLSVFLEEFTASDTWQKNAVERLTTCIGLQILEDGSQWEQSPMYHNEVFHCYLNMNLIARRKRLTLPDVIVDKTKQMAYANIKWQKPNFNQPLLGDSDDTDLRGLLTYAAALFQDPMIKSRAHHKLDLENVLLMGKEKLKTYKALATNLPNFLSVYQQSSGDFYMRDSWNEDATYSSFHMKKLGCGHGHDNLLHFTIFANGRDYLVDGGRYTYVDNEWRSFFKSNKSHNTLGVDDLTNSIYNDSWTNSYEASSEGAFTFSGLDFDYAEAMNMAYQRLEDPVYMKRRFLFLKPDVWLIVDGFTANKKHKYSQYFNFPNDKVKLEQGSIVTTHENANLCIQPINEAQIKLDDSWWSPEYNLKLPSKRAEMFNDKIGFSSFMTLIYFPDKTNVEYRKVPVFSRKNEALTDAEAEAVELKIDNVIYTYLVVHNSSAPANQFYIVNDRLVQGKVVLIKTIDKKSNVIVLKN